MVLADCNQDLMCEETAAIPAGAAMILSALEVAAGTRVERRMTGRASYRTVAEIRLFQDGTDTSARVLYTRDINRRGIGFVTQHRLPLGYGGVLRLPDADGQIIEVHCTLQRCREAAPGWFEGSAHFNRNQPQFDK